MHRSTSRTLRTLVVAAATTATVAIAGPAQATTNQPTIYVNGYVPPAFNSACFGGSVKIDGYDLSKGSKKADVTEFSAVLVRKSAKVKSGEFEAKIDWIGEKGNTPYHVFAYDKQGKVTYSKYVTVNWIDCNQIT